MVDHDPKGYIAIRRNDWTERGWAVVDDVMGAIVSFDSGTAIRRLEIDAIALVDKGNTSSIAKFERAKIAKDVWIELMPDAP